MRIRKNAQLASRGYLSGSGYPNRQVHVCQLNQSRWDAMSFGAEPEETRPDPYSPPRLQLQFDGGDNSYPGNGSLGDSIGAIESVASMIDSEGNAPIDTGIVSSLIDNISEDNNNHNEEVKFSLEETTRPNRPKNGKRIAEKQARLGRRGRPRTTKRGGAPAPASNPYEFYYYSGFGPLWGKRRGEKGVGGYVSRSDNKKDGDNESRVVTHYSNSTSSFESESDRVDDNERLDFIDDDDDEEFEDDGRKRMRKPVKARSLKSLM